MMYLDAAASAYSLDENVVARLREVMALPLGNPSSAHKEGRLARKILRDARDEVGSAMVADPDEVVFTSGVSEALAMAVFGLRTGRAEAWLAADAHPAFVAAFAPAPRRFFFDARGYPDADLSQAGVVGAAIANHETGSLLDVQTLAQTSGTAAIIIDAAQSAAMGRDAWTLARLSALALSSYKLQGPMGVGALLVRKGVPFVPFVRGGSQEHALRAGTEAVIAIAGFARALSSALRRETTLRTATSAFETTLRAAVQGVEVLSADRPRLAGISAVRITGVPARALQERLDTAGVAIATGAACASQSQEPSHLSAALGLSRERGLEVFRVSFRCGQSSEDGHGAARAIAAAARALRGEEFARD